MMTVDEAMNHAQSELECAFEKWLTDECPSGDCESVESQWNESFVHQELVDELQPVMVLTWEVRRLREENDRQRFDILAMNQSLDLMREENERLRKDAERYRWLSDDGGIDSLPYDDFGCGPMFDLSREAIDAARGAK